MSGAIQVVTALSRGTTRPAQVSVQCWSSYRVKAEAACTFMKFIVKPQEPSGRYRYRTVVTICTAQWSLYVPPV